MRPLLGRGPAPRPGDLPAVRQREETAPRKGPNEPGGIRRVHAGCGPRNLFSDWWNVDIREFQGVDEVVDMTSPWPWRRLDYVFGEHFLEHLSPSQALQFLREAAVALAPEGRLRLSTPGLEWVWLTHFNPNAPPDRAVADCYRINRAFHGWGHMFLYSRPMLERILDACGFTDVSFHAYGESDDPALRDLERHGGYSTFEGWPSVWIVEAIPNGRGSAVADVAAEIEQEFERYVRAGH